MFSQTVYSMYNSAAIKTNILGVNISCYNKIRANNRQIISISQSFDQYLAKPSPVAVAQEGL